MCVIALCAFAVAYYCDYPCSGRLVSDQGSPGERHDSLESIPVEPESDSQYWTRELMKAEESDPLRFV